MNKKKTQHIIIVQNQGGGGCLREVSKRHIAHKDKHKKTHFPQKTEQMRNGEMISLKY